MTKKHNLYAEPRVVTELKDCYFYHTVELPGHGLIKGSWDLRGSVDTYLGGVSFAGKRVLDVGSANGFLSFEMEQRGAKVVAYDLSENEDWDIVPFSGLDIDTIRIENRAHIRQLNNAFWLGHRLLDSKADMVYGSVYNIPKEIGPCNISVFGCILEHLRDPFLALHKAALLTTETIVVVEVDPFLITGKDGTNYKGISNPAQKETPPIIDEANPAATASQEGVNNECLVAPVNKENPLYDNVMFFLPDSRNPSYKSWYLFPAELICRFLTILGFSDVRVSYHNQIFGDQVWRLYTVVGTR